MRDSANRWLTMALVAYSVALGVRGFSADRADDEHLRVPASLVAWRSGEVQRAVERLTSIGIARHAPLVRTFNQALWSVLGVGPAGLYAGRDNQIYMTFSVREYCGLYPPLPESDPDLRDFPDRTLKLVRRLGERGRAFIVVTTPSKAALVPEHIPRYLCAEGEAKDRVGSRMVSALRGAGVPVVDGVALTRELSRSSIPIFPAYGAHWNQWGAHPTAVAVLRSIAEQLRDPLPTLSMSNVELVPEPSERSEARAHEMGIYWGSRDRPMPVAAFSIDPPGCGRRATLVGDSFAASLIGIFESVGAFASVEEFYYLTLAHISHPSGARRDNLRLSDIDWARDVFASDVVILEINEGIGLPKHARVFVDEALRRMAESPPSP